MPQIICDAADGSAAALRAELELGIGEDDVPGIDMPGAMSFPAPKEVPAQPASRAVEATTIASSQSRLLIRVFVLLGRMAGH
ncbi:hypothetical protein [Cryobacterium sp. TMT4-31]|uniref:hypothetical protein n=1 Tax=Cryobacterium sp. TMT4-31 TaxID=1259259 RepID=UPI001069F14A|nr:hypothetical protein [Cryobacterium sp. TMT4-31]TFC90364.1 hypothetical protein E3T19_05645 [Cryobacterium sp. TMT4-31]